MRLLSGQRAVSTDGQDNKNDVNTQSRIRDMRRESERLAEKIENVALTIAENASSSRSLVDMIERLERKDEVDRQIAEAEMLAKVPDVTEKDIRFHYSKAREPFKSGELPEIRQLINLYLERVVVYREHVEVILRVLPIFYDGGMGHGCLVRELVRV